MIELSKNEQTNIVRIDINMMEQYCLKKEQVECPVYHRFGPGIYIREVHIPAGTFAIGLHQSYKLRFSISANQEEKWAISMKILSGKIFMLQMNVILKNLKHIILINPSIG